MINPTSVFEQESGVKLTGDGFLVTISKGDAIPGWNKKKAIGH